MSAAYDDARSSGNREHGGGHVRVILKALRSPRAAALTGATLLLILAGTVIASGSPTPLKVCVPVKEGKPIATPKGGVCKAGATLVELGAEGPRGEAGAPGAPG